MSFSIQRGEAIENAIRRIAKEQTGKAIQELKNFEIDPFERAHQVRKRCKKIRGLIRLVRPAFEKTYQQENAWYRDSAKRVAFLRDSQVVLDTFNTLLQENHQQIDVEELDRVRGELARQRKQLSCSTEKIDERIKALIHRMEKGRDRISQWKFDTAGFKTISAGLLKTYSRAQAALRLAMDEPSAENLHQWRKRVKYHWYHARILRRLWKPMLSVHADEAKKLSDLLGDSHDLFVMEKTLLDSPLSSNARETIDLVMGMADRDRVRLRTKSYKLGQRLLAEKPKCLKKRYSAYWAVFRKPKRETVSLDAVVV